MKSKKSALFNIILFIVVLGLTYLSVLHGEDLSEVYEYIAECEKIWLIPAFVCVLLYIWGESVILWIMFGSYKIKVKKAVAFLFSAVGFFFSCITPSASGGQPMQLYFMKKEKIPVPVASVVLIIVTVTYKTVLVILGIGGLLFAHDFIDSYFGEFMPVFYLGIFLNVVCVTIMLMMLLSPSLVRKMMMWLVHILDKIHVFKKTEAMVNKIEADLDSYHETSIYMVNHRPLICSVFVITILQRCALFAVTCFVYKAFELSGTSLISILILQGMISVAVDMLPLPGGMGISENLFLVVFAPIFGELVLPGVVLSRGIGYYSELIISAIFTVIAVIYFAHKSKRVD